MRAEVPPEGRGRGRKCGPRGGGAGEVPGDTAGVRWPGLVFERRRLGPRSPLRGHASRGSRLEGLRRERGGAQGHSGEGRRPGACLEVVGAPTREQSVTSSQAPDPDSSVPRPHPKGLHCSARLGLLYNQELNPAAVAHELDCPLRDMDVVFRK